jgi:filamentous hemagglutinin
MGKGQQRDPAREAKNADNVAAKVAEAGARKADLVPEATKHTWKPGDSPHTPTRVSQTPSDTTVRRREWKNEAESPTRSDYTPEDLESMQRGRPPTRYNPDKGGMESMERFHEPIPKRDGGTQTVPRWPQEHAAVDPHRRPGY